MRLTLTVNRLAIGLLSLLVTCHWLSAEAAPSDLILKFQETQRQIQSVLTNAKASTVGVGDTGSGVIVSSTGLVLTAAHVSGNPNRRITCRLPNGKRVRARTLGNFDFMDAGMVQLEGEGPWPHSEIGPRRSINAGDWCFALGHPGGFEKDRGVVLRVGRVIYSKDGFIRTDCKLLRGDSGGPLFNLNGEVIGIHSRIGEPLDDNYHTPIDSFHKMWDTLMAGTSIAGPRQRNERGSLGVGVEAHEQGVLLTEIRPGSAAEQAGLKPNDVIQSIDGFQIEGTFDFRWAITKNRPGALINIEFTRGNQPEEITVELGHSRGRRGRGGVR
jgi:serine protease Do